MGYSPRGGKESNRTERPTHFNHKPARTQISTDNEQINCGVITHTNNNNKINLRYKQKHKSISKYQC